MRRNFYVDLLDKTGVLEHQVDAAMSSSGRTISAPTRHKIKDGTLAMGNSDG